MAKGAALANHLPPMRRFARALTGSQTAADGYVGAALEAVAREGALADGFQEDDDALRVRLYRNLVSAWSPDQAQVPPPAPGAADHVQASDSSLRALSPLARAAFLLRAVEGFDIESTGAVLQCSVRRAKQLLDQAGQELTAALQTDVLIIEDEVVISMDLEALMEDLGHRVTHVARTRREAVAAFSEHRPGLVLADIRLADGSSGVDAVNEIIGESEVPVVFITGYAEQLGRDGHPEDAFVITKPFRSNDVAAVVGQALFFNVRAHPGATRGVPDRTQ
ncbi:MAG: response regulator [Proteobacteria bacterium]|nr:response regulator [Pseudomonadota bacterium]